MPNTSFNDSTAAAEAVRHWRQALSWTNYDWLSAFYMSLRNETQVSVLVNGLWKKYISTRGIMWVLIQLKDGALKKDVDKVCLVSFWDVSEYNDKTNG
jgi:hypothetical protein